MSTFGERLKILRKDNAMSQEVLAEKLNVSRQSISKWENDESSPDMDNTILLSKILGVTTDELLIPENERKFTTKTQYTIATLKIVAGYIIILYSIFKIASVFFSIFLNSLFSKTIFPKTLGIPFILSVIVTIFFGGFISVLGVYLIKSGKTSKKNPDSINSIRFKKISAYITALYGFLHMLFVIVGGYLIKRVYLSNFADPFQTNNDNSIGNSYFSELIPTDVDFYFPFKMNILTAFGLGAVIFSIGLYLIIRNKQSKK